MIDVQTLLIDNYDSFTYNLFQLLAEANGVEPLVVRNDEATWDELEPLEFDNVVISPGPGRPDRVGDFGVCAQAIASSSAPLLGVCLGHQGLCWLAGATVRAAREAVHGRTSAVLHDGSPLFEGIPREFQAVRYHSLSVELPLPDSLEPIAWTSDGVLMAVAHRTRPQWGVQFHPESICTEHGRTLLANFRQLTLARGRTPRERRGNAARGIGPRTLTQPGRALARAATLAEPSELSLKVERLDTLYDAEHAFVELYGDHTPAFWLDSSRIDERARFSFIGAADGPLSAQVFYDVATRELRIERAGGGESRDESIFDYLSAETRRLRRTGSELPFDFDCGFVGYFGYELKADCGGDRAHRSSMPDAAFVFADRLIAFDHVERHTYLLCLHEPHADELADSWIAEARQRLESLAPSSAPVHGVEQEEPPIEFRLGRSHAQYLKDIAACSKRLREGDTYEICLTNKITADVAQPPLALYRTLRRVNPAPFCAYLRFGERAVLSSSPERFLRIDRGRWAEAKPIKGTSPRGASPAEDVRLAESLRLSEKNRAENLMIADLLRNDLGAVCEVGTVHVPELMHVESYETVHQLVSTVRGLLRDGVEAPDCIRACFPAGSMTGAPKKRTMEIIDELEGEARGVYAGAIGYVGLSGACDLSVVIRTIVIDGDVASLGVGGAIVMQSQAEEEYQETLLKARAPIAAIDPRVDPHRAFELAEPAGRAPAAC
ncbi:MAG TPA: aminodeoxychorismate synthase component I [Solirubrobacteraceae bacterium]